MGFPRQKYWCGLPFPSPEELLDPRVELMSPALQTFFISEPPGKPQMMHVPKDDSSHIHGFGEIPSYTPDSLIISLIS